MARCDRLIHTSLVIGYDIIQTKYQTRPRNVNLSENISLEPYMLFLSKI